MASTDTGFTPANGLPDGDLLAIDSNSRVVTKPFTDILPDQTGHSLEFLQTDGAGTLSWAAAGGGGGVTAITGTANQVLANGNSGTSETGAVTLTLPQDIATSSTPRFGRLGLGVAADATAALYASQAIAAATSAEGIILQNSNAATSGSQMFSPRLVLGGKGYNPTAGASQTVNFEIEVRPGQATPPTSTTFFWSKVNGSQTVMMSLTNVGVPSFAGIASGVVGCNSGTLRSDALAAGSVLIGASTIGITGNSTDLTFTPGVNGLTVITNQNSSNTVLPSLRIQRNNSTGAGAAGMGVSMDMYIETSTTINTQAARLACLWTDATHASRTSAVTIETVYNAGALAEAARVAINATGALLTVGVAGTRLGSLALTGNTSGTITIAPSATAGTQTYTIRDQGHDANFVLSNVTGGNANCGQATLSGGTVVVNTTFVAANSLIFLTNTSGANAAYAGTIVAGVSFTITGTGSDVINWFIINQ